ncbi:lanthionine synthetase C family protein [Aspergillus avenaceus]|uniref:Lanthionine synthetase C family protein n=1 Tax=Aspergillus avenaceus TaxID=36643 RepID=A0A5N6TPD6_ASPAV|nr:lanthionine synthetase C family protein [Aspergillus avenaceus]
MSTPQFYPNTLHPVQIDTDNLQRTLCELRTAVNNGAQIIQKNCAPPNEWGKAGLYVGVAGIALTFLRLERQAPSLIEPHEASIDFGRLARERIIQDGPGVPLEPGRLSPVGSSTPVTAAVMRILEGATSGSDISMDDISCLQEAVKTALQNEHMIPRRGRIMGADEIMFGRPGLLWSILNLRLQKFDVKTTKHLQFVFDSVPNLIDVIVRAGRQGCEDHVRRHGDKDALPLMWTWTEGQYYLGATGVLAVLLACQESDLNDCASRNYLPWIADTITGLCRLCIVSQGHLPTRIPLRHSSHRQSPLVQICHGGPGLLLLMACARRCPFVVKYWKPEWDKAIHLASQKIWEQGILSKGGGLCHGIAGNALPLLLMHNSIEFESGEIQEAEFNQTAKVGNLQNNPSSDYFLSRALALLKHAQNTPPYSTSSSSSSNSYRMPDHPLSLHEGLAGTVCAWAEACVAIQSKLRKLEIESHRKEPITEVILKNDVILEKLQSRQLGFPTIAYHRPTGLL